MSQPARNQIYLYASPFKGSYPSEKFSAVHPICVNEFQARFKELGIDPSRVVVLKDASDLDKTLLEKQGILVIPGGYTVSLCVDLKGRMDQIRSSVAQGWNYFGSCSGGNFACESLVGASKKTGAPLVIANEKHLLNLLPITANTPAYEDKKESTALVFNAAAEAFNCFWSEGSRFSRSQGVYGDAYYADIPFQPNAAVRGTFGAGKVKVSGIHPEMTPVSPLPAEEDQLRIAYMKEQFKEIGII